MTSAVQSSYELTTVVGQGPHGTVWRARHASTGEGVAVKVLHDGYARDPHVASAFGREQRVLRAFLHPALVRVRDVLIERELALVTEFVDGRSLAEHGPVEPDRAIQVAATVAEA